MKEETKQRKKAMPGFRQWTQKEESRQRLHEIVQTGTQSLSELLLELGRELAEFILYSEREERAGPDYRPSQKGLYKWAAQPGSVYLAGQKTRVNRPRLRQDKEVALQSYLAMKNRHAFSEQFFVDTVHRGGSAFIVALGLDIYGEKRVLGFWEGATENAEVAESLLSDLQERGLRLSAKILFVVDGGKGLMKALRQRYGDKLLLQRCTIHKLRNLEGHLPKKHRQECHRRYQVALEQNDYKEAEKMLRELERWLRSLNESAADSLLEAFEELLTLHRLKVPLLLRKRLHSTNPIESLFSQVRACEKNIKRYQDSQMAQRWLASVLLYAEQSFRKIKGFEQIPALLATIEANHATSQPIK